MSTSIKKEKLPIIIFIIIQFIIYVYYNKRVINKKGMIGYEKENILESAWTV